MKRPRYERLINKIKRLEEECLCLIREKKQVESVVQDCEERYRAFFENGVDGIVILDPETARPIQFNDKVCDQLGYTRQEFALLKITDIDAKESPQETKEHIDYVVNKGFSDFETLHKTKQGEIRDVRVIAQIIHIGGEKAYHCIWRDITDEKQAKIERERLIEELKTALANVKKLSGLVPICANCKKIRDDKGYWNHLESYLAKHSEILFSHGLCQECADKLYGGDSWYKKE